MLLCVLGVAVPARAWVERTVESDAVTIDLERSGQAVVTHELLLAVRGGPLKEFSVGPVDPDAELLTEATATLAKSGQAAGLPIPLSMTKEENVVHLRPMVGKGLRSGKFAIRFGYRTDLAAAGRVSTRVGRTVVEWSGPSFVEGIDSVRVLFRVPRATMQPRLPSSAAGEATLVEDEQGGVFLGTSRRAADKDELEVVRPHVAKEEVVVWRAVVDGASFDLAPREVAPPEPPAPDAPDAALAPPRSPRPVSDTVPVALAAGLGALYAALVFAKSRLVRAACAARGAAPRPLVPLALPLRSLLAGWGMGGAAFLVHFGYPTLAGGSLLLALAAATHLSPRAPLAPRGPGKWVRLEDSALDEPPPAPALPGRYLDAATLRGFATFAAFLGAIVAAAVFLGRRSSYEGVATVLSAAALLPLFFTGRQGELPPDPRTASLPLLDWLVGALAKEPALSVHPIGRIPVGRDAPDEVRLAVTPAEPISGLIAIEVGLDVHRGSFGHLELPFVIVRVQDGAPAGEALPRGLLWTRGRTEDERVAVLRPKLPTRRITAELVRSVVALVSRPPAPRAQGKSAERSAGKASSTANPGTRPSPAHAT